MGWRWQGGWKRARGIGFIALFCGLILAPSIRQVWLGKTEGVTAENRRLADRPTVPRNWSELRHFFAAMDAWLNDHFGFRDDLIAWNNQIRFKVFGEVTSAQLTRGNNGFLYFNSHNAAHPLSMIHFLCGVQVSVEWRRDMTERLAKVLQAVDLQHPASTLLIVPTKPVVYPENLPYWLQAQCQKNVPPVPEVVANLMARGQARLTFPLNEMRHWKTFIEVYPKNNFHWHGAGARQVADYVAGMQLGLKKLLEIPRFPTMVDSDLQKFIPGVSLAFRVDEPDYAVAGVSRCVGVPCFPEFPAVAAKLIDISRYRSPVRVGHRLLIISDSFGNSVAGNFSEYFSEVWHLSINEIARLSADELLAFKDVAFRRYHPDRVLYVFHDGSIANGLVNLQRLLEKR